MANKAILEARGLGKFLKMLKAAGDKTIPAKFKEINMTIADSMASSMKGRAPEVTGGMKGSIKPKATPRMAKVQIGRGIDYTKPVVFGTGARIGKRGPHNIAKHPFPYEVLDERRATIIVEYGGALDEALKEASLQ